jgi:hypothetical protein
VFEQQKYYTAYSRISTADKAVPRRDMFSSMMSKNASNKLRFHVMCPFLRNVLLLGPQVKRGLVFL